MDATVIATQAISAVAPSGGYAVIALLSIALLGALLLGGAFFVFKYVFNKVIPILEKIDNHLSMQIERDKALISTIEYERSVSKQCFEKLTTGIDTLSKGIGEIKHSIEMHAMQLKR